MATERTALVLGASGGIGGETARALARHGWAIRALSRDTEEAGRRAAAAGDPWDWVPGDAMDRASVVAAAEGASVIVHAVNPPGYRNWGGLVLPMIENTIEAARASGARVLLPGTIYNYGPDAFPVLSEDSPQHPATRKGKIRVEMELRLARAADAGVRSLVLRAGDFFGPRPGQSWFSQAMVKPGKPVRTVTMPGRKGVGHSWAYLPDVAEAFARLVEREASLARFERFHFGGVWDADGLQMAEAIRRAAGDPGIKVRTLPWTLMGLMAPFSETVREMMEVRPLWQAPIRLDNARLVALLGAEPATPMGQAVEATLHGLACLPPVPAGTARFAGHN